MVMAVDRENAWLEAFQREVGIRRLIILHGNSNDIYATPSQAYVPLMEVLTETLRRRGYDEVVIWDPFMGLQNLSATAQADLVQAATETTQAPTGDEYDLGETTVPARPAQLNRAMEPDPFFALVHHHLTQEGRRRYAFVVDWSHYLFGNANSLPDHERGWLRILSRAVRNAAFRMDAESVGRPANVVILVANKLGGIPPVLYQGNPGIKEILIPVPGRPERKSFVSRHQHMLAVRPPLVAGDVAFNDFIDSLDGFTLRDVQQLIRLSRQVSEPLSTEKLINLYKYGEYISPWEELNRQKLVTLEERLKQRVKGQDEAVQKVRDVIVRAYTGLSGMQHSKKQKMPKGVLFFVGPTGVGKTELAKALAHFLFGDEESCLRFDMSEYQAEQSDQRLLGAPPGYVGYEEGGQLTNAVKAKPFSVVLFDEIEKAHKNIMQKFLQILEDGRLTDGKGETVFFSETVIIFTSNIGAAEVSLSGSPEDVKEQFIERVRNHFVNELRSPEILNRIGNNIVPFNFIVDDEFLVAIARAKWIQLRDAVMEKHQIAEIQFANEDRALRTIVSKVDRQNGGRGVLNEIVTHLINPLADFLFTEVEDLRHWAGKRIRIIQAGSTFDFRED